jgi:hypothetical protein
MTELTDRVYCVLLRSGVEIWVNDERGKNVKGVLSNGGDVKFLEINDEFVSVSAIEGIFTAESMKTKERTKRGDWQCGFGYWHIKGQECAHRMVDKSL